MQAFFIYTGGDLVANLVANVSVKRKKCMSIYFTILIIEHSFFPFSVFDRSMVCNQILAC